jgi:hypothetical protein
VLAAREWLTAKQRERCDIHREDYQLRLRLSVRWRFTSPMEGSR